MALWSLQRPCQQIQASARSSVTNVFILFAGFFPLISRLQQKPEGGCDGSVEDAQSSLEYDPTSYFF